MLAVRPSDVTGLSNPSTLRRSMKRILDGRIYDTETATRVCELPCSAPFGDFEWHETALYRSPRGTFFVAGRGGAASMWRQPCEDGWWSGGAGIEVITEAEARACADDARVEPDAYEEVFGLPGVG
jgi:hypothetical protein